MSIGEDLRTFILSDSEISDIVGEECAQQRLPQAEAVQLNGMAGITYRRTDTSNDEVRCLSDSGDEVQFSETWEVDAISEDEDVAMKLAAKLKKRDSYIGQFGSGTVQAIFVRDQRDRYATLQQGTDDARHWASVEFEILGYEPGA